MTKVYVVRADGGMYADAFVQGGYIAIGWLGGLDLSQVQTEGEVEKLYQEKHPDDSMYKVGQQRGQIWRFLRVIRAGDYVVTPSADSDWLHFGVVRPDPTYYHAPREDDCPHRHRRRVEWAAERLSRGSFSVPFQGSLKATLTVYELDHAVEFFKAIRQEGLAPQVEHRIFDHYEAVIQQLLKMKDGEFEDFATHLLTALGFEESQRTGKPGDGGVDATGELRVDNLAKVRLFVQVKRYKARNIVTANMIKQFRGSIPDDCQGAFITTSVFQNKAQLAAIEPGFKRIGLVDGNQLVDLLVKHWADFPEEVREQLGLKPALVPA